VLLPDTHNCIYSPAYQRNLHETPTYGGWVESKGPRYCPSIEDKIVKFKDKESHQIFLEPEGRNVPKFYVQGFSTGLPDRLKLTLLRTLPGLQNGLMFATLAGRPATLFGVAKPKRLIISEKVMMAKCSRNRRQSRVQ